MLLKIVTSSIRYRLKLYIPMLIAIVVSFSLIGAADTVGRGFDEVVDREMSKYGANVILTPDNGEKVDEGVALYIDEVTLNGSTAYIATTDLLQLLEMNPAWIVRGNGSILVGKDIAEAWGILQGDFIEINNLEGRAAILDSGTEFDSFIIANGSAEKASMVLIKTSAPEKYRGKNAVILEEMVKARYIFLESIKKFMIYVAAISTISSLAAVINLTRMDAGARRKEFGIIKALGASQYNVIKVIFAELAFISAVAVLFGITASIALSQVILGSIADVPLVFSINTAGYIIIASFAAFAIASLIYLIESKRQEVITEIRGE